MLTGFDLTRIPEPLLAWYAEHARTLPWRSEPTPYRVWVSEIMLQQTRVEAVRPYYERFLAALPDLHALAACPADQLLKLWEGLGYYNRVRNMQAAARQIEADYGGEMPSDYDSLRSLKGIGAYTAGAIASIAFGRREAAVDGNVLRVLTRLTADPSDTGSERFRAEAAARLREIMPTDRCSDFNQALMELGATVCLPNGEPRCASCPWETLCLAHKEGRETEYPVKARQKPRRIEQKTVLVLCLGDRVLLRKRPEQGLLAGLYEFPWAEGQLPEAEVLGFVRSMGLAPVTAAPMGEAKHVFTHVEWQMTGWRITLDPSGALPPGLIPADRAEIAADYPIPAAYGAYLAQAFA